MRGASGQRTTRRALHGAVALLAIALLLFAGVLLLGRPWQGLGVPEAIALLAALLALAALWTLVVLLDAHFDDLERLAADLRGAQDGGLLPERWSEPGWSAPELRRLAQAANQGLARQALASEGLDGRLGEVVSAIGEGLLVVTDNGLVSLVNGAAEALLRPAPRIGTSVYGLVHRDSLAEAAAAARQARGPVSALLALVEGGTLAARVAPLREAGGLLLAFPGQAPRPRAALSHDLSLHDRPPEAGAGPDTRLIDLPTVVLDGETTGLDVAKDRLVSVAAVRLHGTRIYRQITFDRLVNPGVPIPRASTAIHGISDRMVERAAEAGEVLPELAGFIGDCVLVGHNIGFDLALLAAEARRAGQTWQRPRALDTGHLAAALDPKLVDLNLDSLADRYAVRVEGRHTALGDCLLTAAVWRRLLRELEGAGVFTLAEAEGFARRAERLIRLQRAAGWVVPD